MRWLGRFRRAGRDRPDGNVYARIVADVWTNESVSAELGEPVSLYVLVSSGDEDAGRCLVLIANDVGRQLARWVSWSTGTKQSFGTQVEGQMREMFDQWAA